MTKLKIRNLKSTEYVAGEQQNQLYGGGAEDHWHGFANGELDFGKVISKDNWVAIEFVDSESGRPKGAIAVIDGKTYTFY